MTDSSGTGRTDEALRHPGLTFKIYTVDSRTLERGPATVVRARPSKTPLISQAWPPCECPMPRCPDRAR